MRNSIKKVCYCAASSIQITFMLVAKSEASYSIHFMGYKAKPLKRKCVVDLYNSDVVTSVQSGMGWGRRCLWTDGWFVGRIDDDDDDDDGWMKLKIESSEMFYGLSKYFFLPQILIIFFSLFRWKLIFFLVLLSVRQMIFFSSSGDKREQV